ncbi:uncharacterized protein PRCAT00006359001 [Priceomyces carsonii]|uniref:uncharacterized protein n=1 Tax=Priceomyces carsonii TaxID=28549 RepID=UPI002ED96386|nr:unnamed protein product [Priceomyces carsonii]
MKDVPLDVVYQNVTIDPQLGSIRKLGLLKLLDSESENLNQFSKSCVKSIREGSTLDNSFVNLVNVRSEYGTRVSTPYLSFEQPHAFISIPLSLPYGTIQLVGQGSQFLKYFRFNVSRLITIGPLSSNYLLKTFLPMAASNVPLQYALASWGGLFIDGKLNFKNYQQFMLKASKLLLGAYDIHGELDKHDFMIVFTFFLIGTSVEICSGDVKHWRLLFRQCQELIKRQGGIIKVLEKYNFSNDIKWMLSNLQFHDLLSSDTFVNGSDFLKDYKSVFKGAKLLELDDYGVDPFQGICQPIYMILGDLINMNVLFKKRWLEICDDDIDILGSGDSNISSRTKFLQLRSDYFSFVDKSVADLRGAINKCEPPNLRSFCNLNGDELNSHLSLFQLMKHVCNLYLNHIEKIPPCSFKLQSTLLCSLQEVEKLMYSEMVPCLGFPLLICGMTAVTVEDRQFILETIKKLICRYPVGGITKVLNLIEEIWERNPDGLLCIEWASIACERGWLLFSC